MDGRYEFHESDWKLFRKKIVDWQEDHMDKLNKEYIALLSEDKDASEKFWTLHDRIGGMRAGSAVRKLKRMGYKHAYNMGGITSWTGEIVR